MVESNSDLWYKDKYFEGSLTDLVYLFNKTITFIPTGAYDLLSHEFGSWLIVLDMNSLLRSRT